MTDELNFYIKKIKKTFKTGLFLMKSFLLSPFKKP